MCQFMEERAVISFTGFKQSCLGHTDCIEWRGIAGTGAIVTDVRSFRHCGNHLLAFFNRLKRRIGLNRWNDRDIDTLALSDVKDAVITKKRNALVFTVAFLFEYFPEHHRKCVLAFSDATTERLNLLKRQPKRRWVSDGVQEKQIDSSINFPAHEVLRPLISAFPWVMPGDGS